MKEYWRRWRQQAIEKAAIDWQGRNEAGLSDAERVEFETWRADPRHRAAYDQADAGVRRMRQLLRHFRPIDGSVDPDLLMHEREPKPSILQRLLRRIRNYSRENESSQARKKT